MTAQHSIAQRSTQYISTVVIIMLRENDGGGIIPAAAPGNMSER